MFKNQNIGLVPCGGYIKKCNIKSLASWCLLIFKGHWNFVSFAPSLFFWYLTSFVIFFFSEKLTLTGTEKFKQFKMVLCGIKKYEIFTWGETKLKF